MLYKRGRGEVGKSRDVGRSRRPFEQPVDVRQARRTERESLLQIARRFGLVCCRFLWSVPRRILYYVLYVRGEGVVQLIALATRGACPSKGEFYEYAICYIATT